MRRWHDACHDDCCADADELWFAAAGRVELQLAARARGLGSAWTTLHLRYEREIAELLDVPDGVHQGVLIPTAYYTGETFHPAPRAPLDTVLHVDRW